MTRFATAAAAVPVGPPVQACAASAR
jgi:hypothetical protein